MIGLRVGVRTTFAEHTFDTLWPSQHPDGGFLIEDGITTEHVDFIDVTTEEVIAS